MIARLSMYEFRVIAATFRASTPKPGASSATSRVKSRAGGWAELTETMRTGWTVLASECQVNGTPIQPASESKVVERCDDAQEAPAALKIDRADGWAGLVQQEEVEGGEPGRYR